VSGATNVQFLGSAKSSEKVMFARSLGAGTLARLQCKGPATSGYEHVLLLAASDGSYYDIDAIREPPTGRTDPIRFATPGIGTMRAICIRWTAKSARMHATSG